jgi:hypothetical protein
MCASTKVWTSCYPYAKSKLKIPHFTGVISVLTNWQEWQLEDRTLLKDLEYEKSICRIRDLLDD